MNINCFFLFLFISASLSAQTTGLFYTEPFSALTTEHSMTTDGTNYYYLNDSNITSSLTKRDGNHQPSSYKLFSDINQSIVEYINGSLLLSGNQPPRNYTFCKLDTSGNIIWAKSINYSDINIVTAQHASSSGYYQTGYRDYAPSGFSYTYDITISRFSSSGTFLWSKAYGDNNYRYSNDCSVLMQDEGLVTAGKKDIQFGTTNQMIVSRFDSSGNQLGMKSYDAGTFFTRMEPKCMYNFNDTAIFVCCAAYNTNNNYDLVVFKLDTAGNVTWTKRFYQIGYHEYPISMTVDLNGNPAILCRYALTTTTASSGYFLLVINQNGGVVSSNSIELPWGGAPFDLCRLNKSTNGYIFISSYYDAAQFGYYSSVIATDEDFRTNCTATNGTYNLSFANPITVVTNEALLPVDNSSTCTDITPSLTDRTDAAPAFSNLCSLVGLDETINDIHFNVSPNPASEYITINLDKPSVLSITDSRGNIVYNQFVNDGEKISLENLSQGIYFVKSENAVRRMVKLK